MARIPITPGFNLMTGSYTGNGSDNRPIDVGFRPEMVIVKANSTQYGVFRTKDMPDDEAGYLSNGAANLANSIQSFHSRGFVIGTDATVNSSGVPYYWVAVAEGGANEFATFSYTGTGVAHDITSLPFQPEVIVVKRNGANAGRFKTTSNSATANSLLSIGTNETGSLTGFLSNGFSVGTGNGANASGSPYYGFAFRNVGTGLFRTGTLTGNGSDNRSITGIGFEPAFVLIKNSTNSVNFAVRCRFGSFPGDAATDFLNTGFAADAIQAAEADGFQLGTSTAVNENGSTMLYVALKKHRSRIAAT